MASEWSALDIEIDLKRILKISSASNDTHNSSSPLEDVPESSAPSDAFVPVEKHPNAKCNRNESFVDTNGELASVETSALAANSNTMKKDAKTRKEKKKKKKKKQPNPPPVALCSGRTDVKDGSDVVPLVVPSSAHPTIPVSQPSLVQTSSKSDAGEKPRAEIRPKIVIKSRTERKTVEKGEGLAPPNLAPTPKTSRQPDLSKFNLAHFDSCPNVSPPEEILSILEKERIFPLKKKSAKHPKAHYVCRLCVYHCDGLMVCAKHIKGPKHTVMKEESEINDMLEHIPRPSEAQSELQSDLLLAIVAQNGLREEDVLRRKEAFQEINETLKDILQSGCELQMFGSSITVFGLQGSDLNINLEVREETNLIPAMVLQDVHDALFTTNAFCSNVDMDTGANLPVIRFNHRKTSIRCVIGLNNGACVKTTNLLSLYADFDDRVRLLCVSFRYWAKLCRLNEQQRGTLPPHTFDLMVVYFLQQCDPPVLPVFHEHFSSNGSFDIDKLRASWKSENRHSIGHLWIEMLRFYALPFPRKDLVVCIRLSTLVTTTKKNWRGRKLPVEDPYVNKRNLTRCVTSPKVYDFILMCLKLSFKYFGIPQLKSGPLFDKIAKQCHEVASNVGDNNKESAKTEEEEEERSNSVPRRTRQDTDTSTFSEEEEEEDLLLVGSSSKDDEDDSEENKESSVKKEEEPTVEKEIPRFPLPNDLFKAFYSVGKDEMSYSFIWKLLTGGKVPVLECSLCKSQGHLKDSCPDEILPRLHPLPPMQQPFMTRLDHACVWIWKNYSPCREELLDREEIVSDMEGFVRNIYPDARLELFGSSCNGFGFRQSDLDICLTFKSNETGENLKFADITMNLAEKLKKYRSVYHVVAIPTAKVPIVKFVHRNRPLECDISLYNTLAQHNTRMLYVYSEIDSRVKALGFTVKYFAKICEIGDASRGSLSSYAYILMVIYFLQQRKPPVIPVLQQLYDKTKPPPEQIVDGWNAWFFKDIQNLKEVWPSFGKNRETVGELWLGLLRFYTEEFNFKKHVISIRKIEPLSRFEKLWNKKTIAIEDPFNLSHNLGSGVSRKMNTYIMKTFIMGRGIFGTPLLFPPMRYRCIEDYLFDPRQLTDGPPPNDRCCRACGHIGHVVRECPRKKGAKEQPVDRKENVARQRQSSSERNKKVERNSTPNDQTGKKATDRRENLKGKPETKEPYVNEAQMPPRQVLPQRLPHHPVAVLGDLRSVARGSPLAADSTGCGETSDANKRTTFVRVFDRPQRPAVSRPPPGFSNVLAPNKQLQLHNLLMERGNIARQMAVECVPQCRENASLVNVLLPPQQFSNDCTFIAGQAPARYVSPFSSSEDHVCSPELLKSDPSSMLRFASQHPFRAVGLPVFANAQNARHSIAPPPPPFVSTAQRFPAPNAVAFGGNGYRGTCMSFNAESPLADGTASPLYVPAACFKSNQDFHS